MNLIGKFNRSILATLTGVMVMLWVTGCWALAKDTSIITPYQGWEQAYRINNGKVEAVIVPGVGRLMDFRLKGQENMLRIAGDRAGYEPSKEDGYIGFGGFYNWPAPQDHWVRRSEGKMKQQEWPPDVVLDRGPYEVVDANALTVRMLSPVSQVYGIAFEKTFRLDAHRPILHYEIKVYNAGEQPVRWAVMNLMAVPGGVARYEGKLEEIRYRVKDGHDRQRWQMVLREDGGWVVADLDEFAERVNGAGLDGNAKFFVGPGAGLMEFDYAGVRLERSFATDKRKLYTDQQSQMQFFAESRKQGWYELEVLSPDMVILPGESVSWQEQWRLEKLPSAQ